MTQKKTQKEKFEEAARELETDEREEAFDAVLREIAKPSKGSKRPDEKREPNGH